MRYDVVVVGFRLNASLKPAQALQLVLGLDADTSKELTRRFPSNVLTGVSLSRAERVSQELTDAGAKVEVRESRLSRASDAAVSMGAPMASAPPPDAGRRASHAPRTEDNSGNYEIGEILAPLGRGGAAAPAAPAAQAPTPVTKRASREELDQALRDSFRPDQQQAALSLAPVTPAKTPAKPAPPEKFEVMDNSAFAGMQNFGGGLDGFDEADAPKLQVDEVAFRSIQRTPDAAQRAASEPARLADRWANLSGALLAWGTALLSLLAVTVVTLLAVSYALDPEHLLRPVGLEALTSSAKQAFTDLLGN